MLNGDSVFAGGVPTTTGDFATGFVVGFAAGFAAVSATGLVAGSVGGFVVSSAAERDCRCRVPCVGCDTGTTTDEESEGRFVRTT